MIQLFRVKRNRRGLLPMGMFEGAVVGFTEEELQVFEKRTELHDCFERIEFSTKGTSETVVAEIGPYLISQTAPSNIKT